MAKLRENEKQTLPCKLSPATAFSLYNITSTAHTFLSIPSLFLSIHFFFVLNNQYLFILTQLFTINKWNLIGKN